MSIEQEGEHGTAEEDGAIIEVSAVNAVGLARRILWAAGFQGILIATTDGAGGGYQDVEHGHLAEHFYKQIRVGY